jgi:hypothetical protein
MSRETPAAHLARVKVQFGARYAIASDEHGYTARDRKSGRTIRADSPGDLEALLIEHAAWDLPAALAEGS